MATAQCLLGNRPEMKSPLYAVTPGHPALLSSRCPVLEPWVRSSAPQKSLMGSRANVFHTSFPSPSSLPQASCRQPLPSKLPLCALGSFPLRRTWHPAALSENASVAPNCFWDGELSLQVWWLPKILTAPCNAHHLCWSECVTSSVFART